MEEEAAREKLTELDALGFAFLSQIFIEHFSVPWIFLDATGNQWGTKEFNFLLCEIFRCCTWEEPVLRTVVLSLR